MRATPKKKWTRGDVIALIGIVIAVGTLIAAILTVPGMLERAQDSGQASSTVVPVPIAPKKSPPSVAKTRGVILQNSTIQANSNAPGGIAVGVNTGTMTVNLTEPSHSDTWRGEYAESLIDGERSAALILNCNFQGPTFTGLSYEPGIVGRINGISGTISGNSVHFTKTSEAGQVLSFDGSFDRSAKTIEGKWTSGNRIGTFTLHWSSIPFEIR